MLMGNSGIIGPAPENRRIEEASVINQRTAMDLDVEQKIRQVQERLASSTAREQHRKIKGETEKALSAEDRKKLVSQKTMQAAQEVLAFR